MTIEIREHVPLKEMTTFQIGGPARYFATVKTEPDIREAIAWAQEKKMTFVLLATGSNVLVPDEGLDALVIRIEDGTYAFDGNVLTADTGCNLLELIQLAGHEGLGGWEKIAGIPGTIGGAARGNAGAFGTEMKDVVVSIDSLNSETLESRTFTNAECDFSYRHSFFKDNPEWIITKVVVELQQIDPGESAQLAEQTIAEREKRHLQNVRAAGSYFMNPVSPANIVKMFEDEKRVKSRESRVPAGWLIEKAGMKGAQVGGAQASLQHPNYIVNMGGATAKDVLELAVQIKARVKKVFDIELKEEAAIL